MKKGLANSKKIVLITLSCIIFSTICLLSWFYIIKIGLSETKSANEIAILTEKQKDTKTDKINSKYKLKSSVIDAKYEVLIKQIDAEYLQLENNIKNEYFTTKNSLTKQKDSITVLQTKEFFDSRGTSDEYYRLGRQKDNLQDQISDLERKERDAIAANTDKKEEKIKDITSEKNNEISTNLEKKNNEIKLIKNAKEEKMKVLLNGLWKIVLGIFIIILPAIYLIRVFNDLTKLSNSVKEKWSQIEVLLKRRYDLIPNIVETVKGYAKHEKETLENVVEARSKAIKAKTKEEEIEANKDANQALINLIALSEDYPDLKANANFISLNSNLKETEDKIAYSRAIYNETVLFYQNRINMFPSNMIAAIFNFKEESFFDIDEEETNNVKVNLTEK